MSEQRLEISVPGKLFIAGEYAVLRTRTSGDGYRRKSVYER